jgi:hypothetical protein
VVTVTGQATELVQIAKTMFDFASTPAGDPFAVPKVGPKVARPLRGGQRSLRAILAAEYAEHDSQSRVPRSSALADAMLTLEGLAGRDRQPLELRVGRTAGDELVLDLGDETGAAVVIGPDGWEVATTSPILFRRTELTAPLPLPARSGESLAALFEFLNISPDAHTLLIGWAVSTLFPNIAHPIPALFGEQGTGKTTTARRLVSLIDPSSSPVRAAPRDLDTWAIAAAGSWLVALDNISYIAPWMSDALCRAATGEGLVKRRLYSDDNLVVLSYRRCPILTSIDAGSLRGDLADRLLIVDCDNIAGNRRRTDDDLERDWHEAHPHLLGALCDLTVEVLAVLPDIVVDELPRMADYGRILAVVDKVLGTNGLHDYRALGNRLAEEVVEGDHVAEAVRDYLTSHPTWTGTATDLLARLTPDRVPKGWPTTPKAMGGALRRVAPALRQIGFGIEFCRQPGGNRTKTIVLTAPAGDKPRDQPSQRSQPSHRTIEHGTVGPSGPSTTPIFMPHDDDDAS